MRTQDPADEDILTFRRRLRIRNRKICRAVHNIDCRETYKHTVHRYSTIRQLHFNAKGARLLGEGGGQRRTDLGKDVVYCTGEPRHAGGRTKCKHRHD